MSKTFAPRRQAWLSQLRTACIVVSEQPHHMIRSISVTQRFANVSSDERRELLTLAIRLAGEYGLAAETMDRVSSVTVWISRPAAVRRPEDAPWEANGDSSAATRQSLAGRISRLLRPRKQAAECRPAPEEGPDGTHPAPAREATVES
jgi:hypothetical protein